MQLSSIYPFSARKVVIQTIFALFLLGSVLPPLLFSGLGTTSQRAKVRTEAIVLDVSEARPSRSGKRRLWVKFAYQTPDGTRHVRRRRVRTKRNVSPGQRITVRYHKRRPNYGRVVSLSPPPQKVAPTQSPSRIHTSLLPWLVGLLALPAMGFGVYLLLTGGRGAQRSARKERAPRGQTSEQRDPAEASLHHRTRKHAKSKVPYPPKHRSQVVQRAGWF